MISKQSSFKHSQRIDQACSSKGQKETGLELSTKLIVTTNPGLEDLVVAEFTQRFANHAMQPAYYVEKPLDVAGRILLETDEPSEAVWQVAQRMRLIHHVLRPVADFRLHKVNPLESIQAQMTQLEIAEMVGAGSFRVSCNRSGTHEFTSIDVQRAAGAGLVERYDCKVDLTGYDINVRVDVNDDLCTVLVQLTHEPLDARYDYAYRPRVALKANVAFALLLMAGVKPDGISLPGDPVVPVTALGSDNELTDTAGAAKGELAVVMPARPSRPLRLLDPFCGSGTILIEGAACLANAAIFGNERFEKPFQWTLDNLTALGLEERVSLTLGDARDIDQRFAAQSMDVIVTNPPFGAQLGQETNFYSLYLTFLSAAAKVLADDGRLVMLVWKRKTFNKVVRRVGLHICHARVVDLGGLFPGIFVLKK